MPNFSPSTLKNNFFDGTLLIAPNISSPDIYVGFEDSSIYFFSPFEILYEVSYDGYECVVSVGKSIDFLNNYLRYEYGDDKIVIKVEIISDKGFKIKERSNIRECLYRIEDYLEINEGFTIVERMYTISEYENNKQYVYATYLK